MERLAGSRTAFLGTPAASVPALAALASASEVALVVTRPDKARGRSGRPHPSPVKEAALAWGLPLEQPHKAEEITDRLAGLDLAVVVAYGQILPEPMLAVPRGGFVNLHFSRLPRWRGAAPVARALLAGDTSTAVDLIQLDAGMDTGDVIARRPVDIRDQDTAGTLTARLAGLGAELLSATLPAIFDGTAVAGPQAKEGAMLAAKVTVDEARLDPAAMPAEVLARMVRAFNPSPGAWGRVADERLKVWESARRPDLDVEPGVIDMAADRPVLGTISGGLELVVVQPAGKGRMPGAAWARGHRSALEWE